MIRRVFSWALYDFANTIFSAIALTTYFPLYLTTLAGANWYLGVATLLSMFLAGMVVPWLGALSDQTGKTKRYLIVTTLTTVLFFACLSSTRHPFLLILFFLIACFFYHSSLVFYNSLLPVTSPPKEQGFTSGLGTGLGYLAVVFALPLAHAIDQNLGRPHVFWTMALLFLLFSLPLFLFVPEREVENPMPLGWHQWREEWSKVWKTCRKLPRRPSLLLFLGGNFFVLDALNSTIFWLAVYIREVYHPLQGQLVGLIMSLNVGAFLASLVLGRITDRIGAIKVMLASSASLALTLAAIPFLEQLWHFTAVCLTGGAIAISGIWTAGRKVLIDLVPDNEIGLYFGLYSLTTKISVIGSLFFSVVADLAGFRTAAGVLVFPAVVGFLALFFSARLR